MSEPAENLTQLNPVARKRGRPKKIEQVTQEDGPPEYTCTIPIDTYYEDAINEQAGQIKRHHYCQNEAAFIPFVTFTGKRKEEDPPGSKNWIWREYTFPTRWGRGAGVCKEHVEAIKKDPRVLLTGFELQAQEGNMLAIGLPKPDPEKTRITFLPFIPPDPDMPSPHLDSLMKIRVVEE